MGAQSGREGRYGHDGRVSGRVCGLEALCGTKQSRRVSGGHRQHGRRPDQRLTLNLLFLFCISSSRSSSSRLAFSLCRRSDAIFSSAWRLSLSALDLTDKTSALACCSKDLSVSHSDDARSRSLAMSLADRRAFRRARSESLRAASSVLTRSMLAWRSASQCWSRLLRFLMFSRCSSICARSLGSGIGGGAGNALPSMELADLGERRPEADDIELVLIVLTIECGRDVAPSVSA